MNIMDRFAEKFEVVSCHGYYVHQEVGRSYNYEFYSFCGINSVVAYHIETGS